MRANEREKQRSRPTPQLTHPLIALWALRTLRALRRMAAKEQWLNAPASRSHNNGLAAPAGADARKQTEAEATQESNKSRATHGRWWVAGPTAGRYVEFPYV